MTHNKSVTWTSPDFPLVCACASLCVLILLAFYLSKGVKSEADFFLGGRRIPLWASAISIAAAEISVMTVLSLPDETFSRDLRYFQFFLGSAVGRIAVALFFVPLIGEETSIYGYLRGRFGRLSQKTSAILFCLTRLIGAGARMMLACAALSLLTGVSLGWLILIVCTAGILYIGAGGIAAVVWGGVWQAVVVSVGGGSTVMFLNQHVRGGIGDLLHTARAAGRLELWAHGPEEGAMMTVLGAGVGALWAFGADQEFFQRLLCVRKKKDRRTALLASVPLAFIVTSIFLAVGVGIFLYYEQHPELPFPLDGGSIYAYFSVQVLPVWLKGLLAAGIVMAAVDIPVLGMTTALFKDILALEEVEKLLRVRLSVFLCALAVGLLAYLLALNWQWLRLAFKAVGVAMSPVLGVFIIGLFTRWKARRACGIILPIAVVLNILLLVLSENGVLPLGWNGLLIIGVFSVIAGVRGLMPYVDRA